MIIVHDHPADLLQERIAVHEALIGRGGNRQLRLEDELTLRIGDGRSQLHEGSVGELGLQGLEHRGHDGRGSFRP